MNSHKDLFFLNLALVSFLAAGCQNHLSSSSGQISSSNESITSSSSKSDTPISSSSSTTVPINKKDLYISPKGSEDADGSLAKPYNFIQGIRNLSVGSTMYLLEGTYSYGSTLMIDSSIDTHLASSEKERKTIRPAFDESNKEVKVIFDFSSMPFYSSNRGISVNTDYWHIMDFEVKGAGDNGVYIGGNHNIIERLNIHDCQDSGLQLGRKASGLNNMDEWPSYNTILNCTSHDNHDPTGEDSDGFACKLTTGIGNIFDGCISYNNVDDGWDLYTKSESGPIGPVTLQNCVAFNNGITSYGVGTSNSDGNGFKLGGESIPVSHKVNNCIAFNNLATGFTDNSNPGTINIQNCTSYNNGTRDLDANNIDMCRSTVTSSNVYKNILSYCDGVRVSPIDGTSAVFNSKDQYKGAVSHCIFYYGMEMLQINGPLDADYSVNGKNGTILETKDTPFVSVSSPQPQSSKGVSASIHYDVHTLLRSNDGKVKLGDFLRIKTNTVFATAGENSKPIGADLSGGND